MKKDINLTKKIKFKYRFKYMVLFLLILTLLLTIGNVITQFKFQELNRYIVIWMIIFISVSFVLIFCYGKIKLTRNISVHDYLEKSLEYFATRGYKDLQYAESITWFSKDIHYLFRTDIDNISESDTELILKLHLILKPNEQGLCLALYHRKAFEVLCGEILKNDSHSSSFIIQQSKDEMQESKHEKLKYFSLSLDPYLFCYIGILISHIIACIYIEEYPLLGNLLIYIPADVLVILIYKGIVKKKQQD